MKGGITQPWEFAPWMTVIQSRFPGCASRAFDRRSALVTTMQLVIMPIMNPVSSKLYTSSSAMLLDFHVLHKVEPLSNQLWIFSLLPLIVVASSVSRFELWLSLHKVHGPSLSHASTSSVME
jgi:hypothetical protein